MVFTLISLLPASYEGYRREKATHKANTTVSVVAIITLFTRCIGGNEVIEAMAQWMCDILVDYGDGEKQTTPWKKV
jgi:hypothetical protein